MKALRYLLGISLLLAPRLVLACPTIDGLIDVNCDQILKIAFVGDSFVAGVGDKSEMRGGYVTRVAALFPNAVTVKYPKPGIATGQLLSLLMRSVPSMGPSRPAQNLYDSDYLILDVGRNDYWVDNFPPRTIGNIKRMVAYLKTRLATHGRIAPILGVTTLAKTNRRFQAGFLDQVNILLLQGRSNSKLPTFLRMDKLSVSGLSKDGLHPKAVGYDRMATVIQDFLQVKGQSMIAPSCTDVDSDGIYDKFESSKFGTNPALVDTDEDGFSDGEELFTYHTNPLDSSSFPELN